MSGELDDQERPSRLHRKDTPHHLKNKRITPSTKNADLEKVASIIAQVTFTSSLFQLSYSLSFVVILVTFRDVCT